MTRYRSIPPVQQFDASACWAASLEWWTIAMGRTRVRQDELIRDFDHLWTAADGADYGTVTFQSLQVIIGHARWNMSRVTRQGRSTSLADIQGYVGRGPSIVGYHQPGLGNHVVVAFAVLTGPDRVVVMDPNGARFRELSMQTLTQSSRLLIGSPRPPAGGAGS